MPSMRRLPLFPLSGDPPDDQAFDFIHIETIASRSSAHDWTIRAHRHRNLFQILLIEQGGGDMTYEASITPFTAPTVIAVSPTVAHGFRFTPRVTDGWVVSFTEDVADALGARTGEGAARAQAPAAARPRGWCGGLPGGGAGRARRAPRRGRGAAKGARGGADRAARRSGRE